MLKQESKSNEDGRLSWGDLKQKTAVHEMDRKEVVMEVDVQQQKLDQITLTSEDAMRVLFKESTVIIENARENINSTHWSVFGVTIIVEKNLLYCFCLLYIVSSLTGYLEVFYHRMLMAKLQTLLSRIFVRYYCC